MIDIELIKIEKTYYTDISIGQPVLKQCSFKVNNGDMIAIIGRSGTGKSTLLHIIGLADKFDKGEYWFQEEDITKKTESQLAKMRNSYFGYIMQDFALVPHMKVYDNIAIPLYLAGLHKKRRIEKVQYAAELVNIISILDKKVNQLSGGQKQRVAIARAIVNDPIVILADEPTGALDSETGMEIMEVFQKLNSLGKTVIIVTHDEIVAKTCKRIMKMDNGQIEVLD